jgi:hypothetical protein
MAAQTPGEIKKFLRAWAGTLFSKSAAFLP